MANYTDTFSGTPGDTLSAYAPLSWEYVAGEGSEYFGIEADGESAGPLFSTSQITTFRFIGGAVGANQYSQITITGLTFSVAVPSLAVMVRMSAGTGVAQDNYRLLIYDDAASGGNHTFTLQKVTNDSAANIASWTQALSNGDVVRLEAEEVVGVTTLRVKLNNVLVSTNGGEWTDVSSPFTSGDIGVGGRSGTPSITVWGGGDLTAPAPPAGTVTIDAINPDITTASITYSYSDTDQTSFEKRIDGGSASAIADSVASITGLTAATEYDLEIRAINGLGSGAWSSLSTFWTDNEFTGGGEVPLSDPPAGLGGVRKVHVGITVGI